MRNAISRRDILPPPCNGTSSEVLASRDRAFVAVLALLAEFVERQDPYTRDHCEQVSQYVRLAAERLALSDEEKHVACCAALLHDVGKIGLRQGVLNKPGPLLPEERAHVETHVRIGYDMLNEIPELQPVADAVLYHHERYDGTGYPEGLAGEEIPVASRIVAVVDAYCAMLDRRSYKEAYSPARARAELHRCAGTQFDPVIVRAVLAAITEIDLSLSDDSAAQAASPPSRLQQLLDLEMPCSRRSA